LTWKVADPQPCLLVAPTRPAQQVFFDVVILTVAPDRVVVVFPVVVFPSRLPCPGSWSLSWAVTSGQNQRHQRGDHEDDPTADRHRNDPSVTRS
jgi:hypothetical protein